MMTGALANDQPARVVTFENRDRNANGNLGDRDGRAGRNAGPKQQQARNGERTGKWMKNTCWFCFCCGLCEEWDSAAEGRQRGVRDMAVRGG